MTLQPGQTVGRYQILEPLGVGGMATVYKAYQPSLEREVALKVLRPGFADDPEFFQRFQREARSIAKLRHPHIVQVFDFEPLDGRYVLAMEYLEGGTLKDRVSALALEGKRLPQAQIGRLIGEVADALTYAHELGIVHRDMKPSNVMLAGRDRAVVTDFGIAKIVGGEGQTQTGVGIGTPEYMAPEQGTGTNVDHRADIYALGVMAYELLTGRVPFVADTPIAIVLAHIRDPLPLPSSVDPTVSPQTERVLLKALAKEPGDRYASATEFGDALKSALGIGNLTSATVYPIGGVAAAASASAAAGAAVPGRARAGIPRAALIGAAALALLLVGGAAFALTRGSGNAPTPVSATASTKVANALRGALIYEAKFDANGSEIQENPGPPGQTIAPNAIRTLDGSIVFTVAANQGVSILGGPTPLIINWRRQFPATYFAELDVKVAPGSQLDIVWNLKLLPTGTFALAARTGSDDSMQLRYQGNSTTSQPQQQVCPPNCPAASGTQGGPTPAPSQGQFVVQPGASAGSYCPPTCPGPPAPGSQGALSSGQPSAGQFVQPETIGTPATVTGLSSGSSVTIGIAAQSQGGFAMFFNGQNVGQFSDARAAAASVTNGFQQPTLSLDVHGQTGTLTLTGFRVYQLAAP